jgi:hypothetical protein
MKESPRSKSATAILHFHDSDSEDPSQPARAQQILNNTRGVLKVDINHLTNIVSVEYDPDQITLDKIKKLIKSKAREKLFSNDLNLSSI